MENAVCFGAVTLWNVSGRSEGSLCGSVEGGGRRRGEEEKGGGRGRWGRILDLGFFVASRSEEKEVGRYQSPTQRIKVTTLCFQMTSLAGRRRKTGGPGHTHTPPIRSAPCGRATAAAFARLAAWGSPPTRLRIEGAGPGRRVCTPVYA